jgi:hypothetical protein
MQEVSEFLDAHADPAGGDDGEPPADAARPGDRDRHRSTVEP